MCGCFWCCRTLKFERQLALEHNGHIHTSFYPHILTEILVIGGFRGVQTHFKNFLPWQFDGV